METPPKHPQTAAMFAALLKALDVSASKLAANISTESEKYSQQTIANYVAGKFKPGQELLAAISRRYSAINPGWLLTGEGEIFPTGRYNEKPATKEAPEPSQPTPPPGGASPLALVTLTYEELVAENAHLHRQLAARTNEVVDLLSTEVKRLRKKPMASADAADLYQTVDAIAQECRPSRLVITGFEQQGVQRQLA